jgi:hypothetical protein
MEGGGTQDTEHMGRGEQTHPFSSNLTYSLTGHGEKEGEELKTR